MRELIAILLLTTLAGRHALGQSTNVALFQEMATECLGGVPNDTDSLVLATTERLPYVRSALVRHWQGSGTVIYLAGEATSPPPRLPALTYAVDEAAVTYERRSGNLERRLHLALRYVLTDGEGMILADDDCVTQRADLIRRDDLVRIEDRAFPETQGTVPQAGWIRRYAEPAVFTAATAVAVYLFFSLRSRRADDS